MELRNVTADDLDLYEAIYCDPQMMEHVGGPRPRKGLAEKLARDAASAEAGEIWLFKIIPDEDPGTAAGTVVIWEHEWNGQSISEIGWMVLPRFQGRGLGSEAVRTVLRRARSESRWDVVHAFPAISNARSNAMCRKMGFSKIQEWEFQLPDRVLRCNHWRLDLRSAGPLDA
jgi:RimJ/RimL family protein N-acetyltransferase